MRDFLLARGCQLLYQQAIDPAIGLDFIRLSHDDTGLGIDMEAITTDYEEEAIRRATFLDATQPVPSATPEDLIILKLIANRSKDHKDLIDLVVMTGLDWPYIRRWAEEWQVTDRLEDLLTLTADDERRGPV